MSRFDAIPAVAQIDVYRVLRQYIEDENPEKVNALIGVYRDDNGSAHEMRCVREAKKLITEANIDQDAVSPLGHECFRKRATELVVGNEITRSNMSVSSIQCVGGSGALRLGAELLTKFTCSRIVYLSQPTYGNHAPLFNDGDFREIRYYRYWTKHTYSLDFDGMLEDLHHAPIDSVLVLHACAHNPTGSDLDNEQWQRVAEVVKKRNLFPFFDCSFQGLSTNDEAETAAIKHFIRQRIELFCAQTFSKNFSLYNERVGNLVMVLKSEDAIARVESSAVHAICGNYSSPPLYGALLVHRILDDTELRARWRCELDEVNARINRMKSKLAELLHGRVSAAMVDYIKRCRGQFCLLTLTPAQVNELRDVYHVYLQSNGRLSFAGLTTRNVSHVANSICAVINK